MSNIVLSGSGRLWCRDCSAMERAAGWTADLIIDWIQEHHCDPPTEEDLSASAAMRQRTVERDQSLAVLEEFAEATKDVPVTFDPSRGTESPSLPFRSVPLRDALGLYPEAAPRRSPAILMYSAGYWVSLFPVSHELYKPYSIKVIQVEHHPKNLWRVTHNGTVLNEDGQWEKMPQLTSDTKDEVFAWLDRNQYPRETAMRLARQAAPHIIHEGVTALEAWKEAYK